MQSIQKRIPPTLLLALIGGLLMAQSPGGVGTPLIWLEAEEIGTEAIPLPSTTLGLLQVFVVYAADHREEQTIWSINRSDTSCLLMTTERMADLERGRYLSYTSTTSQIQGVDQPVLRTYYLNQVERQDPSDTDQNTLLLGLKTEQPELPIKNMQGAIKEFILYDRLLRPQDRQQIESYLALKHGISIRQEVPRHYLSGTGLAYWNANTANIYQQHIAGIGFDETAGIDQTSGQSFTPNGDLLSVGLEGNRHNCIDCYLSWSDNGATTSVSPSVVTNTHPVPMDRVWLLQSHFFDPEEALYFELDSRKLYSQLPQGQHWQLLIDYSGEGDFSPVHTLYLSDNQSMSNGLVRWSEVKLPHSTSNRWHFSFGFKPPTQTASEAFFQEVILSPNPSPDGHFQLRVATRELIPLDIRIFDELGRLIRQFRLPPERHHLLSNRLSVSGKYHFEIISDEYSYSTTLIIP